MYFSKEHNYLSDALGHLTLNMNYIINTRVYYYVRLKTNNLYTKMYKLITK